MAGDEGQEQERDPVGAQLPGAQERPAEADHQDEPTEIQDGGESTQPPAGPSQTIGHRARRRPVVVRSRLPGPGRPSASR